MPENTIIHQAAFEHSLDAILIVDDNAKILKLNPAVSELIRYTEKELIGKVIWAAIAEKHRDAAKGKWINFISKGSQEGVVKIHNRDNQTLYTQYRAISNVKPGQHMIILHDITDHLDIEAELERSEARYRHLNSIYPVGIFHADIHGQNIYINEKASEIMDVSFNEAMGQGWEKHLHPHDLWVKDIWKKAIDTQSDINLEYRFLHKDGRIVWVKGQSVPEYDYKGNIIGYVGTLTDITKLHDAEAQIRRNQIELAHYSRVNSMGEMASGIAHELNQPLTAIANYANGCVRRLYNIDIEPEIIDSIRQIAAQAERAGAIIHHLKDFLRKGDPQKSDCNINHCVDNALSMLKIIANMRGIEIKTQLDFALPIVKVDNIAIEQVIINLITNAMDAMEPLIQPKKNILISSSVTEKHVHLHVADNGPGIDKSVEKNIFNPFVTTKAGGMGIGLSLSRNIIEMHNGKLAYEPAEPTGAIFKISLPIF